MNSTDKRETLPKSFPGWKMLFMDALNLLYDTNFEIERDKTARLIQLMDAAVGIQQKSNEYIGITLSSHMACKSLPLYFARGIEYESAARILNFTEMDITLIHQLLKLIHSDVQDMRNWYVGDIKDMSCAVEYVMRATLTGNRFAKRVLDWLTPDGGRGVVTTTNGGRAEYIRAIRDGERERAIQLGRMMGGGETGDERVRADETVVMTMPPREQKAMSANNIGYLLQHGGQDIEADITESIKYYEMAVAWGSAPAASNLGHLYHCGTDDSSISPDGARAERLYHLAIERGERNFAPRNLALLYMRGGHGVKSDMAEAARCLLLGIEQGDGQARAKCRKSMQAVIRSWKFKFFPSSLKQQCLGSLESSQSQWLGQG